MIVEGIVTTIDRQGCLNVAPMGPIVDGNGCLDRFILRPYQTSTTYRNLSETREGVFHITDNVLLLAQGAIGAIDLELLATKPAGSIQGVILLDACRYYEFRVESIVASEARTTIRALTTASGVFRDFLGFNRARNAVVEAAILATRTRFLPLEVILADFDRLRPLVQKTGGAVEQEAFELLERHVVACSAHPNPRQESTP